MERPLPRISVIIALLNKRETLGRCLGSIATQRYANRELLVMDGGSTDGSLDVLREYSSHVSFWKSEPDGGLYHAFNKAIRAASGDWLYFIGADDYLWDAAVLERIAPQLATAYPPHRVVYGQVAFVSDRGEVLEILGKPWPPFRRRFLNGLMLPHQAVFHHRTLFEARGLFDESFRSGGDYELLLRELTVNAPRFVPDVIVAGYRFGGESSAPQNSIGVLKAFRRAQRLNGIRFPGWIWYASAARTLIRVALWKILGERAAKRVLDWGRALLGKPAFWTRV